MHVMKAIALMLAALILCGCSSGTATPPPRDRAVSDPMNYKVGFDEADITGGGLMHYDSKGMKRDLDAVLNP